MYCSWKHSYYIVNLCSMYSLESFITFWKVRNAIHINLLSILLREFDWIWKKFFWIPVYILVIGTYTCTTHLLKSVILVDNTLLNTKDYISEYTHTHTHTHTHLDFLLFSFIHFCIWWSRGMENQKSVGRKLFHMILQQVIYWAVFIIYYWAVYIIYQSLKALFKVVVGFIFLFYFF